MGRRALGTLLVAVITYGGASGAGAGSEPPALAIDGMTFASGGDAGNDLIVWAEHARIDPRQESAQLEAVAVSIAPRAGRLGVELRCERGRVDLRTHDIRLEGALSGRTSDGRYFETEWVEYDGERERLSSDAPVRVREAGALYSGGGLRFDLVGRRFRLLGGARVDLGTPVADGPEAR